MTRKYGQISEVLKALAHPARLRIIAGLMKNECSVSEIQKALQLPQSTISQHLRILRDQGIIRSKQEKTRKCYKVVDKRIIKVMQAVVKN
ncbi:MAG: winged helix-turn-helix transcriptional regulator [Chitinispirillaceae bacterium]|nr:winged helix-turn-helix transcriptional regulator [Chitinispirillaceae bacterium]